jgi:ATP-dependent DNA helicase DinG
MPDPTIATVGQRLADRRPVAESSSDAHDEERVELPPAEIDRLIDAAVQALAGERRDGQHVMAQAVAEAFANRRHLLVQAGTGTGKSLAYLAPAMLLAQQTETPVIVATATLALQAQLVGRDLPLFAEALRPHLPQPPTFAIFKGRSNYACLARVRSGVPDEQGVLVEAAPPGKLGAEVMTLRAWAEAQAETGGDGDRDSAPVHSDRGWAQVSIQARECPGKDKCPFGGECFAERSRDVAAQADVVVTNHAVLAIDALEGIPLLPEYRHAVIDEAHELVARVTSAASLELSPGAVERAARRARPFLKDDSDPVEAMLEAADALRDALTGSEPGQQRTLGEALGAAVAQVRDRARSVLSAIPSEALVVDADTEPGKRTAKVMVDQVRLVAERMAADSEFDVVWVTESRGSTGEGNAGGAGRHTAGPDRFLRDRGKELRLAPLSVAGLLRDKLFGQTTCVLTSATLKLGGDFDAMARQVGLRPSDRVEAADQTSTGTGPTSAVDASRANGAAKVVNGESPVVVRPQPWVGLDAGSPFDYARQAILYTARRLPAPGREGPGEQLLEQLVELVRAAGGRTLGLFSSRRGAEAAAEYVRPQLETIVLCQGDAQLPELSRQFRDEQSTSLFGTLSLWQGIDVPGDTCVLVTIDRLPFPRPDDPLMAARARAADEAGGNGFLSVSATHAALLLAQGTGRLIRRSSDRGVVACLDPRLVTARYGTFLRSSLPPMWETTDLDTTLGALRRLAADADARSSAAVPAAAV